MQRINRKLFVKEYNKISTKLHMPTSKVAKRAKISQSYAYKIVSPTTPISVSVRSAVRIGQGLGMSARKYRKWISDMLKFQNQSKTSAEHKVIHPKTVPKPSEPKKHHLLPENKRKRHGVHPKKAMVFYPKNDSSSPLARRVKRIMDEEDINTRRLASKSDLNKKRLHEIFNGSRKTVPALTASRIAYGLGVSPHVILSANHYKPVVKSAVLDTENKKTVSADRSGDLADKFSPKIARLVENANRLDDADIEIVNLIVHRLLDAENKVN